MSNDDFLSEMSTEELQAVLDSRHAKRAQSTDKPKKRSRMSNNTITKNQLSRSFFGVEELTPSGDVINPALLEDDDAIFGSVKLFTSDNDSNDKNNKDSEKRRRRSQSLDSADKPAFLTVADASKLALQDKSIEPSVRRALRDNFAVSNDNDDDDDDENTAAVPARKKKKKPARLNANNYETAVQAPASAVTDAEAVANIDMSAWNGMGLHVSVIDALAALGFVEPTPIQKQCVQLGAVPRRDVVGAAETGSGKTLAFGLPIISNIVTERENRVAKQQGQDKADDEVAKLQALVLVPTRELAVQVASHLRAIAQPCGVMIVTIVGGMSEEKQLRMLKRRPQIIVATPGRFHQLLRESDTGAFVNDLTGLRYFALDEADRMVEKAHFDDLSYILERFPVFVEQKSQKTLQKEAEEAALAKQKADELAASKLRQREKNKRKRDAATRALNADFDKDDDDDDDGDDGDENGEADMDGMTETLQEVGNDDDATPAVEKEVDPTTVRVSTTRRRQTFVFSATLGAAVADALANSSHIRAARRRRGLPPLPGAHSSSGDSLHDAVDEKNDARTAQLLSALEFQGAKPPAIVDLTNTSLTVKQLREYRIECPLDAKDVYLYAFLEQHRGRTLVFVNAISAIRRLMPLLELLKIPAWSLHAQKQQRQRLKVHERFRSSTYGVLVATDVAARGLDIPNVDHVVHFQVPRTIELYVHRTGRTARAQRDGISLMLVSPEDRDNFLKLVRLPGKQDKAFQTMVFDPEKMVSIQKRVEVARELEVAQHRKWKREEAKRELKASREARAAGLGDDDDDSSDNDGTEAMAIAAQQRSLARELRLASEQEVATKAQPLSKKAKRKAKQKAHNGLETDADGEQTKLLNTDLKVRVPELKDSLRNVMQEPLTKRRRRSFLLPDVDSLRLMTGSRPDALATAQDADLLHVPHPTASLEKKKWTQKTVFKAQLDPRDIERRQARRLGREKAVAARREAKKARFEASKVKRHGSSGGGNDYDDDDDDSV